jgi:anti-sigma-K factor RskA
MGTNCDTALERLLEADPAELAGQGDSELATHVRECSRCQMVAARLLTGQEALAGALNVLGPPTEVGEALSAVRARRRKLLRREQAWRWGPVAAAATVAAAMVLGSLPAGRTVEGEMVQAPAQIEALVEAAPGQNVMVFESSDQSAKVIWFY